MLRLAHHGKHKTCRTDIQSSIMSMGFMGMHVHVVI